MSFEKVFSSAVQKVKSSASQMITNGLNFSCQIVDIAVPNPSDSDETVYPNKTEVMNWFDSLFSNELKFKPTNEKALEQMKKKGITPKKQPCEIILIIIVPSGDSMTIAVSFPENYPASLTKFVDDTMKSQNVSYDIALKDSMAYVNYKCDSPLKEKDNTSRMFFMQLKKDKIYVENDDGDEVVNYLEE
jgi:hypothetical protein